MNNIKWKDDAVCFAGTEQLFVFDVNTMKSEYGALFSFNTAIDYEGFQLNEARIGDYIEKSELDTEQKYNDAVEVFGLFGFEPTNYCKHSNFHDTGSNVIFLGADKVCGGRFVGEQCKRKLTYNQLMAIGKLKRLMNERARSKGGNSRIDNLACGENGKESLQQTDALDIKRQSEYCGCIKVDISTSETIEPCSGRFIIGESDEGLESVIPDSSRNKPNDNTEITFNVSGNLSQDFAKHIKDIESAIYNAVNKSAPKAATEVVADNVKNPNHYQLMDGVESIEIIARSMTQEQWKGFCLGNMIKYRIRAGKKDALQQDIDKANFYGELYEMHKEKCYD